MKMLHTLEQLATHLYNDIQKVHKLREQRNSRYEIARLYPFESGQICENYSRRQFWDKAMSGHNFSEFFEKRPVWLFCPDHIAVHHGSVCDTLFVNNDHDMDTQDDPWRLCVGLPDDFYSLAFVQNPMVRFCMNIKHYNVSLRFNQTGHFRGVWSIGPQMIEHVLLNDHSWYMQSQTQKYAGIQLAVGFHALFEYEWADDLHTWVESKLEEHEDHNLLRCLSDILHRTNRWGSLYRQQPLSISKGNFNHWVDRHVYIEESAWGYFQKHPELKQLLHERYADDYAQFDKLVDSGIEDIDTYEHMWHHVEGWGMETW
jgi:hypothetical protein